MVGAILLSELPLCERGLAAEADDEEIPSDDEDVAQDVEDRPHARLLDAISSMDGNKRLKHTLRTIHGQNVSEFGFKTQKVDAQTLMSEMMGSLHKSSSHSELKKQLKSVYTTTEVVDTPAPKHIKEKIQRSVGYEKTVKELSKWDPVVTANRKAEQMKFPLEQPTQKLINTHITFRPITALEKEIQAELAKIKPENRIPKGKLFTPAEEEEMKAMSLEEARERRAELMKMRAIMYTKASKLRWQNKIKSKRYRRGKKKEKLKQMEKELEELAVTDPEALMDRMNEVERKRLEERGRLRHMGGGKFARQAKVFSKYDNEKRQQIQDMLSKHKELVKKHRQLPSSSESEDEAEIPNVTAAMTVHSKNIWMQPTVSSLASLSVSQNTSAVEVGDDEDEEEEDEEEVKERKFLASFDVDETDDEDDDEDDGEDVEGDDVEKSERSEEMAAVSAPPLQQVEAQSVQEDETQKTVEIESKKSGKKGRKQRGSTHEEEQRVAEENESKKMETNSQKAGKKSKKQRVSTVVDSTAPPEDEEVETIQSQENDADEFEEVQTKKKKKKSKKQKDTTAQETAQSGQEKHEITAPVLSYKEKPELGTTKKPDSTEFQAAKPKKNRKRGKKSKNSSSATETAISTEEKALMAVVKGLQTTTNENENPNTNTSKAKKGKTNKKTTDANTKTDKIPETPADTLMTIAEAFDDDDVVAEFVEEKRRVEEEEGEKDKDLFVPGWGSWAGAGIVPSNKLRKRFIKKAQPQARTDNKIGHVIISEKKNTAVEKHMLDKIPYPYKTLDQMQTTLSKPIGRDFTSETQFRKNIKPKTVVNRIGQVIQPIDDRALLHGGQKRKAVDIELNTKKPTETSAKRKKKGKH